MLLSRPFLYRELPDGRREISWRVWVLVWVVPVAFLAASALILGVEGWRHLSTVPGEGEVVRVYSWTGETVFDRNSTNYSPVFRYRFSDGTMTEASAGMSHPGWNFDIGSVHAIRYFPEAKRDVVLPGWPNWAAGLIVGGIGLVFLPPALWLTARFRRWQRAGA